MVAMPYGLDPLAHREPDRGWSLFNKTGSDPGTRADVGVVRHDAEAVGYAAIARWPAAQPDLHPVVLDGMHAFGLALRQYLIAGAGSSMST
jgi:beta-lactamase class A